MKFTEFVAAYHYKNLIPQLPDYLSAELPGYPRGQLPDCLLHHLAVQYLGEVLMPEQAIKITCPHCGKIRTINPAIFGVSKGPPSVALEKAYQKKRESVVEAGGKSASWINLKCPNCGKPYQYNPKTRKARPKPS